MHTEVDSQYTLNSSKMQKKLINNLKEKEHEIKLKSQQQDDDIDNVKIDKGRMRESSYLGRKKKLLEKMK